MNFFKIIFCLFLFVLFTSCGAVREGFSNQKKNNSDEFLVEKKNPLTVPVDINELPVPLDQEEQKEDINIKKVLKIDENQGSNIESSNGNNSNLEKSILEKIND